MAKDLFLFFAFIFSIGLLITALVSIFLKVPYVPTRRKFVEKLITAAKLTKGQKVYDLGCGDGRILFAAEKITGCAGEGYEMAPMVYLLAIIKKILGRKKSKICCKNFFKADGSSADVIFCYLTPEILKKIAEKLMRECKKGTKIITHTFAIKSFTPQNIITDKKNGCPIIYIYKI
ncbi:hypothetical protein HZA41_01270 [Candidatus Peregrinibacteria bacterium]|nr:hypothetical protein [Candidatus Peregrinibacteria bacterium]